MSSSEDERALSAEPDVPAVPAAGGPTARDDALAAGDVVADALSGLTNVAHRMHKAISTRVFDSIGADAEPTRVVHDAIADSVYDTVSLVESVLPRVAGAIAAEAMAADTPSVTTTPQGAAVVAAVSGLAGDAAAGRHPSLRSDMTLRLAGSELPLEADAVAEVYPDATANIVVFVHGWSVDESCWAWRPRARTEPPEDIPDPDSMLDYGERLRRDLGYTPLYVRYNTGLHISDNGRQLAELLESVTELWPISVGTVAIVGHSMGGLVARSACYYAETAGQAWLGRVGAVVCLGSPHLGAPLEKGVHVLGWALGQFPETEALGDLVNSRSAGVKDLRHGAIAEDHWSVHDAEELLVDRVAGESGTGTQEVHLISARLGAADTPAARVLGDLLVPVASSTAQGAEKRIPVVENGAASIIGVSHLGLLNNPDVYQALHGWLSPAVDDQGATADA